MTKRSEAGTAYRIIRTETITYTLDMSEADFIEAFRAPALSPYPHLEVGRVLNYEAPDWLYDETERNADVQGSVWRVERVESERSEVASGLMHRYDDCPSCVPGDETHEDDCDTRAVTCNRCRLSLGLDPLVQTFEGLR